MTAAYVYRVFNADDVLLYVGSTLGPAWRMKAHEHRARWWDVATRFEFDLYDTEAEARAAELDAIRSEFPRWNIRDRSPEHPDGHAAHFWDVLLNYPDDCRFGLGRSQYLATLREEREAS